jgi:hypothetical protein
MSDSTFYGDRNSRNGNGHADFDGAHERYGNGLAAGLDSLSLRMDRLTGRVDQLARFMGIFAAVQGVSALALIGDLIARWCA